MSGSEDLAQWPRRRRKLLIRVCKLRAKPPVFMQRTRNEVSRGRDGVRKHGLHRMQKQLLRRVRAQNIHAHRRGEHSADMKEEVQVGAAICNKTCVPPMQRGRSINNKLPAHRQ
jgi:hypothetical protein